MPLPCTGKEDDNRVKELKVKVKEQEATINMLRANVSTLETKMELVVDKKALEVGLRMRAKVDEAFEKGFNACKEQFLALKQLQSVL